MRTQRIAKVADLKPGDRTPWYEVVSAPVKERDDDLLRLVVVYSDTGAEGVVRGSADEMVPLI